MLRARKRLLIVAVLVLAAFVLIPIFRKKDGIPPALKPLSYPYDTLSSIISSLSDGISGVINAAEENNRLKAELQTTLAERQRYGEIVKENQRLQDRKSVV